MQSRVIIGSATVVWWGRILGFPIDFRSRPYNTPALPRLSVIANDLERFWINVQVVRSKWHCANFSLCRFLHYAGVAATDHCLERNIAWYRQLNIALCCSAKPCYENKNAVYETQDSLLLNFCPHKFLVITMPQVTNYVMNRSVLLQMSSLFHDGTSARFCRINAPVMINLILRVHSLR